jgi:hypothetical protein
MSDIQEAVEKGKGFLAEKKRKASRPWSQEARDRQRQKIKDFYQRNPAAREALSEKIRAGWTKERRREFAKQMKRVLAQKTVREKISAGLKRH